MKVDYPPKLESGMKSRVKKILKNLLPPFVFKIKRWIFNQDNMARIAFFGNYTSWDAALKDATGYDSALIFEKVKCAAVAVKEGRATYERDSVLFYEEDYNWPLLAMLLKIAGENRNKLSVLDFGGSLGSTYFQHRKMLSDIDLEWFIIEQKHLVEFGRKNLEDNHLYFFYDVDEFNQNHGHADVILLSSVLPYLSNPCAVIENLCNLKIPYLIIDRTPFLSSGTADRLTVQHVPDEIYKARYPAWFFNRERFFYKISKFYSLVFDGMSPEGVITLNNPQIEAKYCMIFLKRKMQDVQENEE